MLLTYTRYHYDKNDKLLLKVILPVTARRCMGLSHETQKLRKVLKSSKQNLMQCSEMRSVEVVLDSNTTGRVERESTN